VGGVRWKYCKKNFNQNTMAENKNPFISRVQITNFRNFLNVDVSLGHKQVIIGENNVGKTNFLRAIQLILDTDFSDTDRQLVAEDFHDSIDDPLGNGAEIEIKIEIQGYEHNRKLVAQFSDALISDVPPTLLFTYRYVPNKDEQGNILNYKYVIFQGNKEEVRFTNEERNYINIYVIKALRDVERELKGNKNSPLYKLVKQYEISTDHLEEISDALKEAAEGILELDEIVHIKDSLINRFSSLSGLQTENEITLRTFDIDTERLLYTLQVYMGLKERPVSELSLGLANILYVSLMLLLLKDKTIIPVIKAEHFATLQEKDKDSLLANLYEVSEKGNYVLKKEIEEETIDMLYSFMDEYNYKHQAFTILAVEEPEAHLHPVLQRLIYREVLHNSNTSVIFTSHSTYIASVAPLNSIVHVRRIDNSSKVFSTANLAIEDKEKKDIERYVDAKRGEIYFGKGIILAEGITEEYFVPAAASLQSTPLDDYGIVVCNIDSTNFKPYVQLLNTLNIPWVLFTDGDYYETRTVKNKKNEDKQKRIYHIMATDEEGYYRGNENIEDLLVSVGALTKDEIPEDYSDQDKLFRKNGCFVGRYTLEVDMMENADEDGIELLKTIYNELKPGEQEMQENFEEAIDDKDYWLALKKIDNNISKGRFAQRLANDLMLSLVPGYIKKGTKAIIEKIKKSYE
jgi:putative ATP-dependent endonuclease of OLD family